MIFGALVAVLVQAFGAGSETAFVAANRVRLTNWLHEGRRGTRAALDLLERKEALLVVILVCTDVALVAASFLFTTFFVNLLGARAATLAMLVTAALCLLVGDFLPKAAAAVHADAWAVAATPVFRVLTRLIPGGRLLRSLTPPREQRQLSLTRSDFLVALRAAEKSGLLPDRFAGIVANLFSFSDTRVSDIMTPVEAMRWIRADAPRAEIETFARDHGFSRYPAFDAAGRSVGVLHVKDLLLDPAPRFRAVSHVPWDEKATRSLNRMKASGVHLALVHDRAGMLIGLVTLEDLVEELIGEIRSEG